jgi:hypothetical protein
MLEILPSPKHVVAVRLKDGFTADDVAKMYKAADDALKDNERISFFAEFDDSVELTFEGLLKDAVEGLGRLGQLSRFYRAAVVTDKKWMAAVARFEGLLLSLMDVRVFGSAEREKALAWASETPAPLPKPEPPTPGIHMLQTTSDRVLAYEIDGHVNEKDVEIVVRELNEAFSRHDKVDVLVRMKNYSGFDFTAIFNDDVLRVKYRSFSKVAKYAVVGAKPWMRNFLELIDPLFSMEIKIFDLDEEEAAWEWIGARQALLAA